MSKITNSWADDDSSEDGEEETIDIAQVAAQVSQQFSSNPETDTRADAGSRRVVMTISTI